MKKAMSHHRDEELDVDADRPVIRVLMALPSLADPARPALTAVVNLFDVELRLRAGFRIVAKDPEDEAAWTAWRAQHPEAT